MKLTTGDGRASAFELLPDNRLRDPDVRAVTFLVRHMQDPRTEYTVLGEEMWVLNRLGAGAPVEDVLARILTLVESRDPNSNACIMRASEDGAVVTPMLAPRLAPLALEALRKLDVGPFAPAGGAVIHFGIPRFTSDFGEDEAWAGVRDDLTTAGYRACWSAPILSMMGGAPYGTIDVYRRVAGRPTDDQNRVLVVAGLLAAVAFDHEAQTRSLRFRATHDPLTQLPNRTLFAERLAAAGDGAVGVLFVDLDRFKLVNDTLGHEFGDELLCAVSMRLATEVSEPDVVARFGGDEFTILLAQVESPPELVETGRRILAVVSEPYEVRGQTITIGASAGATFAARPPEDPQSLVRNADTALYHAKDRGRGRVEAFDDALLTAMDHRLHVERVLREAIGTERFWVEYQPVVRLADMTVVGAEALARCCSASGELVSPATFVPVAEESGLIPRVFSRVLADACAASLAWNSPGNAQPLTVWVNLSAQQLGARDLIDHIGEAIEAADADPARIGFEVTERGILPDPVEAATRLRGLAQLGCRVAVDDFGTGYSSLGYLQELPVDTVKLDRSFVVRAAFDNRSRAIVEAVVGLARAIGLSCVAEGVETADQLDVVAGLGCEIVQGYVFSGSRRAENLSDWMGAPILPVHGA
jgi:diguanylate cyclase (GGDEF)-like protein